MWRARHWPERTASSDSARLLGENIEAVRHLHSVGNARGVELAGLERGSLLEAFLPGADAYDLMMPDVKYVGGLTETLHLAAELRKRGMRVPLHNPTGSVCHAVSLHVSAVIDSDLPLKIQWGEAPLLFDLANPALPQPYSGRSAPPTGAGHGAALPVSKLSAELPEK